MICPGSGEVYSALLQMRKIRWHSSSTVAVRIILKRAAAMFERVQGDTSSLRRHAPDNAPVLEASLISMIALGR